MLSSRVKQLTPSPTLLLDQKVKALQAAGEKVLNLGLGEPDFVTPSNIREAGKDAIDRGFTHYTAPTGILELRELIVEKLRSDNHIAYGPDQIIIGAGSKEILYLAFQTLVQDGDEVLIPVPNWSSYAEQVKLAGANPILVPIKPPFIVTADDLEAKITKRTKLVVLASPANPTGAVIPGMELNKIADLAVKYNLMVISDEIYEKIIYGSKHISISSFGDRIKDRTVLVNGPSKAYAMTGWRIGYAAGPVSVISAMVALQSQIISCASSISQMAAVSALRGDQKEAVRMVLQYKKRRDLVARKLSKIKGLKFTLPAGAFYFFVDIRKILGKYQSAKQWCEGLLTQEKVALTPGEAFDCSGYFRLSFAASEETLTEALNRIERFINDQK